MIVPSGKLGRAGPVHNVSVSVREEREREKMTVKTASSGAPKV